MLDRVSEITRNELHVQCEMEERRPFTLNEHYFIRSKEENYTKLVALRQPDLNSPSSIYLPGTQTIISKSQLLGQLATFGFSVKNFEQLSRLRDPDEFAQELLVISEVLAYFKVAFKRMIDAIPMRIEQHFILGFCKLMEDGLIGDLGLVGEGGLKKCETWAADNPEIKAQRENLLRQKEILVRADEILMTI